MNKHEKIRDIVTVFQDFKDKPDDKTFKEVLDELMRCVIYLLEQLPESNE